MRYGSYLLNGIVGSLFLFGMVSLSHSAHANQIQGNQDSISFYPLKSFANLTIRNTSFCYMITDSGEELDLTHLCNSNVNQGTRELTGNGLDSRYLSSINNFLDSIPSDERGELSNLDSSLLTSSAREYCRLRSNGLTEMEIYEAKSQRYAQSIQENSTQAHASSPQESYTALMTSFSLASRFAANTYCPSVGS